MNKFQTYFGQIITDDELNEIFNSFALAIEQFIQDFGYFGLCIGGEVVQNPAPNLTVLVNGPSIAYDQNANRISLVAPQIVNCAIDENNQPTAVQGSLNEKYLSIFLGFQSIPTDPREDELGESVFFRHVASHKLYVAQASEAPIGTAPRPALRGDLILLADVRLVANQMSILTTDVSTTRTQVIFDLPGVPLAIREKSLRPALQAMLNAINGINTSTLMLPAIPGSPTSLAAGSVLAVITAFLAAFNELRNDVDGGPDLTGVAFRNQSNNFTQENTFTRAVVGDQIALTNTQNDRPLIQVDNGPGSDDKWKEIFQFRWGNSDAGGQRIRIYTGHDGQAGAFLIAMNCFYDLVEERWEKRDNDLPATAVIWKYKRIQIITQEVGKDNWETWINNHAPSLDNEFLGLQVTGSISATQGIHGAAGLTVVGNVNTAGNVVGQEVQCTQVSSSGPISGTNLQANGNAVVSGNVTVQGLLRLGIELNGIVFVNSQLRTFRVSLAHAQPSISMPAGTADVLPSWWYDHTSDTWKAIRPGKLVIPIYVPLACYIERVYASFNRVTGSAAPIFRLYNGTESSHSQEAGNRSHGEPVAENGINNTHLVADCINADASPSRPNGMSVMSPGTMQLVVENPAWTYDPNGPFVQPVSVGEVVLLIRESGPGLWTTM